MQAQTTPGTGSQQPVPISNLGFTKSGLEMLDRFFNRNIFFISAAKRKEDEKPIEVLTKEHGMVKFANFNGEHPRRSFWASVPSSVRRKVDLSASTCVRNTPEGITPFIGLPRIQGTMVSLTRAREGWEFIT